MFALTSVISSALSTTVTRFTCRNVEAGDGNFSLCGRVVSPDRIPDTKYLRKNSKENLNFFEFLSKIEVSF